MANIDLIRQVMSEAIDEWAAGLPAPLEPEIRAEMLWQYVAYENELHRLRNDLFGLQLKLRAHTKGATP